MGGKERSDGVGIFAAEKWVDSIVSVERHSDIDPEDGLVISGIQNPEETSHQTIINVSISPVQCSHCTLWKVENVHLIEATTKMHWQYYHLH